MKRSVLPLALPWLMVAAALLPTGSYSIDAGRFVRFVLAGVLALTVALALVAVAQRRNRG